MNETPDSHQDGEAAVLAVLKFGAATFPNLPADVAATVLLAACVRLSQRAGLDRFLASTLREVADQLDGGGLSH